MKTKQSGFAVVEGLLILVIVAMVAGIGYYVWHAKQQSDKLASETGTSSVALKTPKQTAATPAEQKYLSIKEWGVKMKTDTDTADAYYVFENGNGGQQNQFMNLDSKGLDALKAGSGVSCKGEYIALLGRYAKNDPALTAVGVDGVVGVRKTVGDYVYSFATHKQYAADCLFDSNQKPIEPNTTVYNKKVDSYTKMFDTITAQ
jgi:hypothetical protein